VQIHGFAPCSVTYVPTCRYTDICIWNTCRYPFIFVYAHLYNIAVMTYVQENMSVLMSDLLYFVGKFQCLHQGLICEPIL
jgi:hypothetical protein